MSMSCAPHESRLVQARIMAAIHERSRTIDAGACVDHAREQFAPVFQATPMLRPSL
jgi:hypothetical protein